MNERYKNLIKPKNTQRREKMVDRNIVDTNVQRLWIIRDDILVDTAPKKIKKYLGKSRECFSR